MGMFDSVMVPCPKCGTRSEFQSKSGRCLLDTFTLENAPDDVLLDVNRHGPHKCVECDTLFVVEIDGLPRATRTLEARSVVWEDACGGRIPNYAEQRAKKDGN
jgi:hypothetical protein